MRKKYCPWRMSQDFKMLRTQNLSTLSVYNHYNRVRANLSILEQNELGRDTEIVSSIDCMYIEAITR